jgi:hypothetical protein
LHDAPGICLVKPPASKYSIAQTDGESKSILLGVGVRQNFAKVSNLLDTLHTKGIISLETSGIEADSAAQSWLAKK